MKTKKFVSKLILNKSTVTNLEDREQVNARGGISGDICIETYVCPTRVCTCDLGCSDI